MYLIITISSDLAITEKPIVLTITNTQTMIEIWNANGGTGGFVNATQENQDIWKHVQTKFEEGWFIRQYPTVFGREIFCVSLRFLVRVSGWSGRVER